MTSPQPPKCRKHSKGDRPPDHCMFPSLQLRCSLLSETPRSGDNIAGR